MCYTDRVTPLRKFEHHHFRVEVPSRQNDPFLSVSLYTSISIMGPLFQEVSEVARHVQLFVTSWTVACQAPLSMGFSRQEYWTGLPFPSPGDLPDPGIKAGSPTLQADSLPSEPPGKPLFQERSSQTTVLGNACISPF